MRAAIALGLVVSLAACFPHDARYRRYAKYGEGGALVLGVALQFVANKTRCEMPRPGTLGEPCLDNSALDTVGLAMIIAGLLGFATTVMTTPEERPDPTATDHTLLVAAPQAFCAALRGNDTLLASAALRGYVKSIGAMTPEDVAGTVHAWLARQGCVAFVEVENDRGETIVFTLVGAQPVRQFFIDPTFGAALTVTGG